LVECGIRDGKLPKVAFRSGGRVARLDHIAHLHQTDPVWATQPKNPRIILGVILRTDPHFDGVVGKQIHGSKATVILTRLKRIISPVAASSPIDCYRAASFFGSTTVVGPELAQ
jgi:hypothetical protein